MDIAKTNIVVEVSDYEDLREAIIWVNKIIKDACGKDIFDLLTVLDTDGQFYNNRENIEILRELLRENG